MNRLHTFITAFAAAAFGIILIVVGSSASSTAASPYAAMYAAPTSSAATPPSIAEPIVIPRWRVIGPFESGTRESGVDPLGYFDGKPFTDPLMQAAFPSIIPPGGEVRWNYIEADKDGTVKVDYSDAMFKPATDEWGAAGAGWVSVAFAYFDVAGGPKRAIVDCENTGSFKLNGMPYYGDIYGDHKMKVPVVLKAGRNEIKLAFGRGSFNIQILPVPADLLVIDNDATVPDIIRGESTESGPYNAAVPFVNATGEWLEHLEITVGDGKIFKISTYPLPSIAPYAMMKPPLLLVPVVAKFPETLTGDTFDVPLKITEADKTLADVKLKLRIRNPEQSRVVTFKSDVDGSVQYYCLLPPTNYDPKKTYGLIISCHGAGVEASGQADAYKPKDWAFVVAATNRRRFGFDWQDWGRLDLLEVWSNVISMYPIDENRVHLTGHSMGGHGTWYNGFMSPDLWASMSPSAGWTTFPLYVPYFLRRNEIMGNERMNYIWQMGMRDDNTLVLSENAMNIPVFAVEGGADDDVPPPQPRLLVELLKKRGYDVKYWEVPGMPHWWDDPKTPGLDCVDSARHNEFWKSHVRNPLPEHVFYRTHNYSNWSTAYWITIDKPERVCEDIIIDARITGPQSVSVKTTNVAMFSIALRNQLFEVGPVLLDVDGQIIKVAPDDALIFKKVDEEWRLAEPEWKKVNDDWRLVEPLSHVPWKAGRHYGPWKQAFYQPFLLVAGTQGTPEQNDWNLHMARMYAARWWYQSNGFAQIVRDTDVTEAEAKGMNLILFGGPESNDYVKRIDHLLPIRVSNGGVSVGDRFIKGELAVKFVFPNPDDPTHQHLILVQEATSLAAAKRLPTMNEIFSGAGYPDWIVWGKGMDMLGLGGVSAAGYFDLYWNLDDSLSFYNIDEDR